MRITIFFLVLFALLAPAIAADYKPVAGEYSMGGKTFYDQPEGEPQDTHMYFVLTGAAAKDLFSSMKVPAKRDECVGDGSQTKRVKEMQCTRSANGKEHRCWFGIDVKSQRITNGVVC
ncbi:MAG: hypothetical protein C0423_05660 [Methylibium sp.]|nr:hypothetical protein [Methylibium sp.]